MAGAVTGGGALLLAPLRGLCDQMASRDVLAFLQGQKIGDGHLRKLKMKLLAVKGVLNDAEAKQMTDADVNDWVDELKDALYDAEDLLDDMATEALRCKMEPDSDHSTHPDQVCDIKSKIEEITGTLEYLSEKKDALGLKQDVVGGEVLSKRRIRSSLVDESGVCGRQDDIKKILDLLFSSSSSSSSDIAGSSGNNNKMISVVALVGMGGIGKTTLAQLVYKDRSVVDCFDLKAWVCLSEEFDLVNLTKSILKAMTTSRDPHDDNEDLNMLQCQLEESLSRKKFLLVLDDVWNENYHDFEKLLLPFNAGHPGSRILVTTRSNEVARAMRSVGIYHVGELPFEDCWLLFARHAFENGDSGPHPKLEKVGKKIVKKCKGLPLAAKTLGAALYSELRVKQWKSVLNNKTWDLPNNEIIPALRLSYSFLSPQLKRCFSYCSIIPKDHEFGKEELILLWMAEGFLLEAQARGTKAMEEVGDGYFCDLVSRSFFQKSSEYKSYFVMHDLINDLAQLVSGKVSAQLKDGKLNEFPEKLRHLSYIRSSCDRYEKFETLTEVSGLRTFLPWFRDLGIMMGLDKVTMKRYPRPNSHASSLFCLSKKVWHDMVPKVQYLRVLSFRYYNIPDLPDSIGDLKHLRYLNLTRSAIRRLPDSICRLYNLQTLILYGCQSLVELPRMMSRMMSLRHLNIQDTAVKEMPNRMGELKNLQKLSNYVVGKQAGSSNVGELRRLSHIGGSLVIRSLQNVVDGKDASKANLVGKQYLDELDLEWDCDQNEAETVLDELQPHSNIKRLTIHGYSGSRFPNWLGGGRDPGGLFNVVSLRLWRCENLSALPPLGQLPFLKHLYVSGMRGIERVGAELCGIGPSFVSLKVLSFHDMSEWKEWSCSGGGGGQGGGEPLFPRLKELYIQGCPLLTGGLPLHLPLLTSLCIVDCEQFAAPLPRVPSIRELIADGRDISKWKKLPPSLHRLGITNSDSLEPLLEKGMMQCNASLQRLAISRCAFSRPLHRVCLPLTLRLLLLEGCKKLEFLLPELFKCRLPVLVDLLIEEITFVDPSLSMTLDSFPSLRNLCMNTLKGLEFLSISVPVGDLPSMESVTIRECPNLASVCFEAAHFQRLELIYCPELTSPIRGLPSSLTSLLIHGCIKFTTRMEFGALTVLPSLTNLSISDLVDHSSLDGTGLHLLASLRRLWIFNCPKLQSLMTRERLPASLSFLYIQNCPLLRDRCKRGTGEYWPLISHIQSILIDDQLPE